MDSHAINLIIHYLEYYDEPKFEVVRVLLEPRLQAKLKRKDWKKQIMEMIQNNNETTQIIDVKQEIP